MLEIASRTLLVVTIAGLCSGAFPALFWSVGIDDNLRSLFASKVISMALVGALIIGMPIALLLFAFVRRHPQTKWIHLVAWANLAATLLTIPLTATGGTLATVMFGIPIFIAANVFAVAGWFIVIKPIRTKESSA